MEEIQDTQGALWEVFIQSKKGLLSMWVQSMHLTKKWLFKMHVICISVR